MKKLPFLLIHFLVFWSSLTFSQNITFTINHAPCNNDGVITVTFPNVMAHPITVTYVESVSNLVTTHVILSGYTDVLNNYSGNYLYVIASDPLNNFYYNQFDALPFSVQTSVTPGICPSPTTVSAWASGGVAPYIYSWKKNNSLFSFANPLVTSLNNTTIGLTVSDANGCLVSISDTNLYLAQIPSFSFNLVSTNASCTNGSASVGSISGSPVLPISYLWSNGATSPTINGLQSGYCFLTLTDAIGCSNTSDVYVGQVPYISVFTVENPATCNQANGSSIAFASGGMPPYAYSWGNGNTTNTLTNVQPDDYIIKVEDANGCVGFNFSSIGSTSPIYVTSSSIPSSCVSPTGSASLTINGGTLPYQVQWDTQPVLTGTTISNLPPGNYSFAITDALGCRQFGTVPIAPVSTFQPSFSLTFPQCQLNNGSITVAANNQHPPFTYTWSNGGNTNTISNLGQGVYTVQIADAVGCKISKSISLSTVSSIQIGFITTPTSCLYTNDGAITTSISGGTPPYSYGWNNGQTTAAISGLGVGNYNLVVTDAAGCLAIKSVSVYSSNDSSSCYCTLKGNVYLDLNSNCIKDSGEAGVPNIQLHLAPFGYKYADSNGDYTFQVPSGNYTLSENVNAFYPLAPCQNNSIPISLIATNGCTIVNDIANNRIPQHDLKIKTWKNGNPPVPGNPYNQYLIIENNGTITENSILAAYVTDGQLNSPTILPSGFTANSSNPKWFEFNSGFDTLVPGANKWFDVSYNTPANIPLNTLVNFRDTCSYLAPMSNWLNDYSPWDNISSYSDVVIGSFDPNYKEVNPKGRGANGYISRNDSILDYAVHFENIGTWHAQNIVVIDTLDADLDWTSLIPGFSTHKHDVYISENGVAKFAFNNIYLSSDESRNKGMFTYSIKVKPHATNGTIYKNRAAVFFDYNAPIFTNQVINTLDTTGVIHIASLGNPKESLIQIFPNPATKQCSIHFSNPSNDFISNLELRDARGRLVKAQTVDTNQSNLVINIDVSDISSGFYFVVLKSDKQKNYFKKLLISNE